MDREYGGNTMNTIDTIKQVTSIEYVGPCQIQTTSPVSVSFTACLEAGDAALSGIIGNSPHVDKTLKSKNNRQTSKG